MSKTFLLALCALIRFGSLQLAHSGEITPSVELQIRGQQIVLTEQAQKQLREQALQLVETSNFHSDPGDKYHFFTLHDVQSDYRKEVAGKFLLISFPAPMKIQSRGGELMVAEIVVGLNRPDFASSLFTIDETGRIIAHTKYSGERCIEILKVIKQFINFTENEAPHPTPEASPK